jgi:hypothetical protein
MKKKLHALIAFGALAFFTGNEAQAQYCIPTYFNDCIYGDNINDFDLSGTGLNHIGSGCSPLGYGDFTADLSLVANMELATPYNFLISHDYTSSQYVKIWIDFNNNQIFEDVTELLFTSSFGSGATTSGTIQVPISTTPANGLRMRVMVQYAGIPSSACATGASYGETHDYTVNILPTLACQSPDFLTLDVLTATGADVSWTEPGTANDYIIEWGFPGFIPGTGAEEGTATINGATNYSITGLLPSTDYSVYVRADCGVVDGLSYWTGPLSFTTLCVPITTLPWTEDFESATVGADIFPSICWLQEDFSTWYGFGVYDNGWYSGDADALSGDQFLSAQYGSNTYIWTPEVAMIGGQTYEFSFNWAGDLHDQWQGEVYVNSSQSSVGATMLGMPFVEIGDMTTLEYTEETYCFTPATDGNYSFAIFVNEVGYWYYLNIDDMAIRQSSTSAGTDDSYDICQSEGLVDLNALGSITDPIGVWTFASNPSALLQDTLLNTTVLPAGILQAIYLPKGCLAADVTVTLNIQAPSSAGSDGPIDACMNQQIDLLGALSGTVNFGGTWYDESNTAIPDSYFMTGTTPGDYEYTYVTNNGTCPNDSSVVTLTVLTCDYLTLDESALEGVSVYPNPTTGVFYISTIDGMNEVQYVVTDLNGRTITTSVNTTVGNSELITVDLSDFEDGIYMLRVFNSTDQKVYRIVKN